MSENEKLECSCEIMVPLVGASILKSDDIEKMAEHVKNVCNSSNGVRVRSWKEGRVADERSIKTFDEYIKIIQEMRDRGLEITIDITSGGENIKKYNVNRISDRDSVGSTALRITTNGVPTTIFGIDAITADISWIVFLRQAVQKLSAEVIDFDKITTLTLLAVKTLVMIPETENPVELVEGCFLPAYGGAVKDRFVRIQDGCVYWLSNNICSDGGIPYKTYVSGKPAHEDMDNPIRQWMTTGALAKFIRLHGREDLRVKLLRNTKHNIDKYYVNRGDIGSIEFNGSAKLGAIAVAGTALLEVSGLDGGYRKEIECLINGSVSLWTESGKFKTFLYPVDRDDNHNFYPGETLYFWSILLKKAGFGWLEKRFYKSLEFYRNYFRRDPNPAFVPWHTLANANEYIRTGNSQALDFVFEMNDWLLDMQQDTDDIERPVRGRFYNATRPDFGPPHSSSTAIYLESLIVAMSLAERVSDNARIAAYMKAIDGGVTNILDLQFNDLSEMVYTKSQKLLMGGIRTTTDRSNIRVDNVQHALSACNSFFEYIRCRGKEV